MLSLTVSFFNSTCNYNCTQSPLRAGGPLRMDLNVSDSHWYPPQTNQEKQSSRPERTKPDDKRYQKMFIHGLIGLQTSCLDDDAPGVRDRHLWHETKNFRKIPDNFFWNMQGM